MFPTLTFNSIPIKRIIIFAKRSLCCRSMKNYCFLLVFSIAMFSLSSCKKTLDVNAAWKDITVVYGLLDQTETVHYVKITKAFLGPGNALQFAQIPDSSNYSQPLLVTMDEYNGSEFLRTIILHDTLITNKDSGVFYFPVQKVYCTTAKLTSQLTYHLSVKNTVTGKLVEGNTSLIGELDVEIPMSVARASFQAGKSTEVKWISAKSGKRYQVNIRIRYAEATIGVPNSTVIKTLDWLALSDIRSFSDKGGQTMDHFISGDAFFVFMGSHISVNPIVTRALRDCDFIFTVGSEDLSTYMDVTEPSMTIIQERPAFSDIINGIGLFTARNVQSIDSLLFSDFTLREIKTNQHTKDLGF